MSGNGKWHYLSDVDPLTAGITPRIGEPDEINVYIACKVTLDPIKNKHTDLKSAVTCRSCLAAINHVQRAKDGDVTRYGNFNRKKKDKEIDDADNI